MARWQYQVLAFVPIVVAADTTTQASSDSGVITERQVQYQAIAFTPQQPTADVATFGWRPVAPDLVIGPPGLGADCQPFYGGASFPEEEAPMEAPSAVYPSKVYAKPGRPDLAQSMAWGVETPAEETGSETSSSDSGVIWQRQVQYQPVADPLFTIDQQTPKDSASGSGMVPPLFWIGYQSLAAPFTQQAPTPDQPYLQHQLPVSPRVVGWALPAAFFTPSPDSIQAGWRPVYPDSIARRTAPVSGDSAFTPAHEATEGNALDWTPRYPDWLPPIVRPAGGLSFSPFPIAQPEAPQQPYHQPQVPVPVQRRTWTYPWLAFVNSPDSIHTGWQGSYPAWIANRAMPVRPSLFFTPAHEATEGNSLSWWPRYPDWMPPIKRPEGRFAVNVSPLAAPEAPQQPYHQPEIPVQPRRVGWALPSEFFVNSPDSIQIGWTGHYPAWIASRQMPVRPSLFFTPQHEATEGNSLSWWPRYPDRFPPLWRSMGLSAFSPFPIAQPEAPQQPYHQPDVPVQPRRVGWAVPFSVWVPQHNPTEGNLLGWTPRYPDWIARRRPTATGLVAGPVSFSITPEQPYQPPMLPVRRLVRWTQQFIALPPYAALPIQPWTQGPEPVRRRPAAAVGFVAWHPRTLLAAPDLPLVDLGLIVRPKPRVILEAAAWSTFTPPVPAQFWTMPPYPVRTLPKPPDTEFAWHPDTPIPPVPDLPFGQGETPVWSRQWHPSLQTESRGPIEPLPPTRPIQRVIGIVGAVLEQTSASYIATLRDPQGNILPGSILQTLRLTLYVVNRDNTITVVNSRLHQPCLNENEVTVYDALQTTGDGRRFNLRWQMQPNDTVMVDSTLAFERHIMLWEYTWSAGVGKHEATVVVHNLSQVS